MSQQTATHIGTETPDAPVSVVGTDHVTLEGTDPAETIAFYRDLLGLPLVLSQPNLDRNHLTHLYFDTGDGRLLTFFVHEDRERVDLPDPDPGQVHHLAFRIEADAVAETYAALEDAGKPVSEYDRGAFHALYTEDHNGLTIELVADKFEIPDARRGEVLAHAHGLRLEDGAEFVTSKHMVAALEALGLPVVENDIRPAAAGRDYR
ncbi:VOC family protein [Salinirubellus salinus]|jgi:catechol 2,3-dioxygenase-like lactoylglutathione lyase family enzyme|uniref:VOC family protein n=1 Tax=Salinirubellus salinus TaxID=1364945 RepID=A0A9E7UAZ0_9EURY|nr:VOC family protein [Salinirubellus salinus]UWM54542.1 VOC family protein [Salinirubellus salinus]